MRSMLRLASMSLFALSLALGTFAVFSGEAMAGTEPGPVECEIYVTETPPFLFCPTRTKCPPRTICDFSYTYDPTTGQLETTSCTCQ